MQASVTNSVLVGNQQTSAIESLGSNFFEALPNHLSDRVKKREGGSSVRLLTNEETGGSTAVKIFSSNHVEPAHTHYETKQIFVVIDGELKVWLTRESNERIEKTLKRGDYVVINPGELHGFSGNALVGGVDVGKGTTLDTYEEGHCPNITPILYLAPMLPMNQGSVTIQTPDFEQRELLSGQNRNIEIMAEMITTEISSIAESNRLVVIVSGQALKTDQNGEIQQCQAGDCFFVSSNESYTVTTISKDLVVTILFNLTK